MSKHFNMRGNMDVVQGLEVFSLRIVPWKTQKFVFYLLIDFCSLPSCWP